MALSGYQELKQFVNNCYFESDYDAVANEVANNENGSIQTRGLCKNENSRFEDQFIKCRR